MTKVIWFLASIILTDCGSGECGNEINSNISICHVNHSYKYCHRDPLWNQSKQLCYSDMTLGDNVHKSIM